MGDLTRDWLAANGWRCYQLAAGCEMEKWRRACGHELAGGPVPFQSADDLCIDLSPSPDGWFCWVHQCEPRRHIHIRMLRTVKDVICLWEGLTGRAWPTCEGDIHG